MELGSRKYSWCFLLVTLWIAIIAAKELLQADPYVLSATPCVAIVEEMSNADFICVINDRSCSENASLYWSFVSHTFRHSLMLKDGDKYGIWHASHPDESRSSLRVRHLIKDTDVGVYVCTAACGSGSTAVVYKQSVELCIQNAATGVVFCGSAPVNEECMPAFGTDICNDKCNDEQTLFSGGNCRITGDENRLSCASDACTASFEDDHCDNDCRHCSSDGGDCLPPEEESVLDATQCCLTVVLLLNSSDDKAVTVDTLKQLHMSLSRELGTALRKVGHAMTWSLEESGSIKLIFLNHSHFIDRFENKHKFTEVRFSLHPQDCHQEGSTCFHSAVNAAKYLTNRIKLPQSRAPGWASTVSAIGVLEIQNQCSERYGMQPPPGESPKSAQSASSSWNRRMDAGSIIGLSLGLASAALLIGVSAYSALYRRTLRKKISSERCTCSENDGRQLPCSAERCKREEAVTLLQKADRWKRILSEIPAGGTETLALAGSSM